MNAISPAILANVSLAHTLKTADIIRKIEAVSAALDAGHTVKELAQALTAAAVSGLVVKRGKSDVVISPVSQQTLGRAKAALTVLDKLGVSLATAKRVNPDALADFYRAVSRHGTSATVPALAAYVDAGIDPAEKLTAAGVAAAEMTESAIAERKSSAGEPREASPDTSVSETDIVSRIVSDVTLLAGIVHQGKRALKASEIDALNRAFGALARELAAPAPAPKPRAKSTAKTAA